MKTKPKVVFLSCYTGIVSRGVETFEYELSKRLTKKFDVTVFCGGASKIRPNIKVISKKTFFTTPSSTLNPLRMLFLDLQSLKILLFTIKFLPYLFKNKYEIVVVLNGGWQTLLLRIFSKISKSKLVITGQAGIGFYDLINIFFRPDAYVALTSDQQKWAKKLAGEMNVVKIPNGVDLAKFNPKASVASVSLERPIVVCCSALDKHKRVDLTIKAVAKTNMSLLLIGDGELKGQIDALGKRLLGKRYARVSVPYEKIASYYRAGSVFTMVSETEAFGIAYVEALACNLPVVATSDATRQEIIGKAGILTDPTNIEKYARDLEIAVKTNYRNIPYDQSLKFSWNSIAEKYADLLKSLQNAK